MTTRAALALGSNLGDRLAILQGAVADLLGSGVVRLLAASSVYETDPVGGPDQGPYLNAVVVVDSDLDPRPLLALAQDVESRHGRVRLARWGARTLDVDVLSFGSTVSSEPDLTLPHPRAHERAFVLVPWAEADPSYVVPGLDASVCELLARLPATDPAGVRRVEGAEVLLELVAAP